MNYKINRALKRYRRKKNSSNPQLSARDVYLLGMSETRAYDHLTGGNNIIVVLSLGPLWIYHGWDLSNKFQITAGVQPNVRLWWPIRKYKHKYEPPTE